MEAAEQLLYDSAINGSKKEGGVVRKRRTLGDADLSTPRQLHLRSKSRQAPEQYQSLTKNKDKYQTVVVRSYEYIVENCFPGMRGKEA